MISNWLLTPEVTIQNGSVMKFWTRSIDQDLYPDRLQVRMSTNGSSTNVGTSATDVGDFTNLLLEINPTETTGQYPEVWTQYTVTVTGVPTPTTGRFAFRYFVQDGGPTGSGSNYIGIDSFEYVELCGQPTPTPTPTPETCPIVSQDFEAGFGDWTTANNSTGGTDPNATAWTVVTNPHSPGHTSSETINSGGGAQFAITNADAGGSGVQVNTTLTSPSFSLAGFSGANLKFKHYLRYLTNPEIIEASTDGGSTWTTIQTYTSTQGTASAFANATVSLNAYAGQPDVQIRFHYQGGWIWYWAVDDIIIEGVGPCPSPTPTPTPTPTPSHSFSVNDVRLWEGNSGTTMATFTVTYTQGAGASVSYGTGNRTATAGVDYTATSGTLTFPASGSDQTQTVSVPVVGDTNKEPNEVFYLNLSAPTNGATILNFQGIGIIVDEDRAYPEDYDRDLHSDYSVFRPSEARWYIRRSTDISAFLADFGLGTDKPVTGDFDGDGKADIAVYRASTSTWYVLRSSDGVVKGLTVGSPNDKPVPADYNGDGVTDLATYHPATGMWTMYSIADGTTTQEIFGISTDTPVPGDYDGDGKTDVAIYRDGAWWIHLSNGGYVTVGSWGNATDKPLVGDFDGDGMTDLTVYRNGKWWILGSLRGASQVIAWGVATDIPAPADYDADGTTDVTVFRPSLGDWFVLQSGTNTMTGLHWGLPGDIPIASTTVPQ